MKIRIDTACPDDLPLVLRLLAEAGLPEANIADHLGALLVARSNNQVVGSAAVETYGDDALLRSVTVAKTHRGMRLGHRLTEAALTLAAKNGARQVYLLTTTAAGFFLRLGFSEITRDTVPTGVRNSVEFTSACPASAQVLVKELD